jgi:hypothetical protein
VDNGPLGSFSFKYPHPTAGVPFTITITAIDQYGNTVETFTYPSS